MNLSCVCEPASFIHPAWFYCIIIDRRIIHRRTNRITIMWLVAIALLPSSIALVPAVTRRSVVSPVGRARTMIVACDTPSLSAEQLAALTAAGESLDDTPMTTAYGGPMTFYAALRDPTGADPKAEAWSAVKAKWPILSDVDEELLSATLRTIPAKDYRELSAMKKKNAGASESAAEKSEGLPAVAVPLAGVALALLLLSGSPFAASVLPGGASGVGTVSSRPDGFLTPLERYQQQFTR